MPRTMSSGFLAAIKSSNILPAIFVTATFKTGPIYVWTGYGSITWNSHTWLGVGKLGSVSSIEEASSISPKNVTLTMNGFDSTLLTDVLSEFQVNAPVTIYLGMFDSSNALIADPVNAWAGRMDQPVIDVSGTTAIISISCENRLLAMNTPAVRRYTNDDQRLDYPDDKAFSFVNGLAEVQINWGRVPSNVNNR